MSAPMDVLAVLDDCIAALDGCSVAPSLREARAAVVDLANSSEAAHHHLKELRRRVSANSHDDADYLTEVEFDTSALHAALASCRGGES